MVGRCSCVLVLGTNSGVLSTMMGESSVQRVMKKNG